MDGGSVNDLGGFWGCFLFVSFFGKWFLSIAVSGKPAGEKDCIHHNRTSKPSKLAFYQPSKTVSQLHIITYIPQMFYPEAVQK